MYPINPGNVHGSTPLVIVNVDSVAEWMQWAKGVGSAAAGQAAVWPQSRPIGDWLRALILLSMCGPLM